MRILVVDDSSPHRRMLTAIFGHGGHEVLTAADGEAALDTLAREPVDAVVSDVRMPKLDGFQLCRAIRRDARWERLPFIFYSSVFIGGPARDLGRDVGATAYLDAKDITPQQMASELDRLVARTSAPSTTRRSCACWTTSTSPGATTRSCSTRCTAPARNRCATSSPRANARWIRCS